MRCCGLLVVCLRLSLEFSTLPSAPSPPVPQQSESSRRCHGPPLGAMVSAYLCGTCCIVLNAIVVRTTNVWYSSSLPITDPAIFWGPTESCCAAATKNLAKARQYIVELFHPTTPVCLCVWSHRLLCLCQCFWSLKAALEVSSLGKDNCKNLTNLKSHPIARRVSSCHSWHGRLSAAIRRFGRHYVRGKLIYLLLKGSRRQSRTDSDQQAAAAALPSANTRWTFVQCLTCPW